MAMRPSALYALLLVAAVGCGVPDNSAIIAKAEQADKALTKEPTVPEPKKDEPKKPGGEVTAKPAEQDPAKLGLGVVDTKVGTGDTAAPGDTCYMLYTGRLKDKPEKVFDSTAKRNNEPFAFPLGGGQVIKGWDIGIVGMKVGGKRTLTIPANLAYGSEAKGDDIPANSDLVFDIELLALLKPEDANTVVRNTIKPGTGPAVKQGDVVTITYKSSLINGTMVDDNGGKPLQFKVGSPEVAVPGLNAALEGMKKGETIEATIPPNLGLRPMGPGGKVPPNSILKFTINLVKIG